MQNIHQQMSAGEKESRLFSTFSVWVGFFGWLGFFIIVYLHFGFPHFPFLWMQFKELLSLDTWDSMECRDTKSVTFLVHSWEIAPGTSLNKTQKEKED